MYLKITAWVSYQDGCQVSEQIWGKGIFVQCETPARLTLLLLLLHNDSFQLKLTVCVGGGGGGGGGMDLPVY